MALNAYYYPNSTGAIGVKATDSSWSFSGETALTTTELNNASVDNDSYAEWYDYVAYPRFKLRIPISETYTGISNIKVETQFYQYISGGASDSDRQCFIHINNDEADTLAFSWLSGSSTLSSTGAKTYFSHDFSGAGIQNALSGQEMTIAIGGNDDNPALYKRIRLYYLKITLTYTPPASWTPKIMMVMSPLKDGFLDFIRKPLRAPVYVRI